MDNQTVNDVINHPAHYTNRQYECIDEMVAVFGTDAVIAHCKCCAWKYRYRAGSKGNADDAENDRAKSDWYINKMIELQNGRKRNCAVVTRRENQKDVHASNREFEEKLKAYVGRRTFI